MTDKIVATRLLAFTLLLFIIGGCTQSKPMPGYARAGDSIVVGLGGIHRNAGSEAVLKESDLTISITDSGSNIYELAAQNVFKSYPDYNSVLNTGIVDGSDHLIGLDLTLFDGGWFALIPLSVIGDLNAPLPLTVGEATVSITSPKLTNTAATHEGDLLSIPLEIIAGVSTPDLDYLRQFVSYGPSETNFVISPDDLSGLDSVGGAFLAIEYYDDSLFRTGVEPMVVPSNHNPFVQLSYNVVPNGNGTGTIFVTLLNPAGFKTEATAARNSSSLADLDVKLLYFSNRTAAVMKPTFALDAASSYYIDLNGDVIDNLEPTMIHAIDL